MEAERPDKAGEAASEGDLAHKLAELMLSYELKRISKMHYDKALKAIEANKHYSDSMWEYIDQFKAYVMEQYAWALTQDKGALIFLEQHLNMSEWVPEGFGTGDVVIVLGDWLLIIDLKFGKGVKVDAVENKQMMLYALGALNEYSVAYDINYVRMTIYQPRIDNFSTWDISVEALEAWAEDTLRPTAELAWAGEGKFKPGKHCQFCKVSTTCKANADYQMQLATDEFKEPAEMDEDEMGELFLKIAPLIKWANSVKAYMFNEALKGKKWPGLKLIQGKSPGRKITDFDKAVAAFKKAKLEDAMFMSQPKLLGITALDKNIGKGEVARLIGKWIDTPPGAPALVIETDPRNEYHADAAAAKEFGADEVDADN